MILIVLSAICAAAGAWLLFDYGLWHFTGTVTAGTVESFENGKPVVSFEMADGQKATRRAERITNIGYFLANVQPGEIFNVSYREGMTTQVRVHGHLNLVAGALLFMPLLGALARQFNLNWLGTQVSFAATMAVIMVGGWVLLKLVRRNY
ncbi:MAG: hypothetical protein DYH13_11305 [Alphaproteobacteria bacterium PRO2]|nr:hypothetical protein [Alphaproteobacteria bacterium PRO2]